MAIQIGSLTNAFRAVCGAGLLLTLVGCNSKLPTVSGQITLDGRPLSDANVMFMPKNENQSPAQGTTDALGKYTLEQEEGVTGIQAGEYSVRISTFQPGISDVDPAIPAIKERVPIRYNLETELKAVVGAEQYREEKPFDFKLMSAGPIFQPAASSY